MDRLHEFALATGLFHDSSLKTAYASRVKPSMFQTPLCAKLWAWALPNETLEVVTLVSQHEKEITTLGGLDTVMQIVQGAYFASRAEEYVKILEREHGRKQLQDLSVRLATTLSDPTNPTEPIWEEVEKTMLEREKLANTSRGQHVDRLSAWLSALLDRFEGRSGITGIPSGFSSLDGLLEGLQRKDLILVGARTSMGKSAFSAQLMLNAAQAGYQTAFFSLEMSASQVFNRCAANLTNIDASKFRKGNFDDNEWQRILMAYSDLEKLNVLDERGIDTDTICSEMRRLKHTQGLDLVIVDYAQLVAEPPIPGEPNGERVGRVAEKIRTAAAQCDCAVILLSQVSRRVEQRQDKRPMLSDLADSGKLEAAADVVIFLYRDDYYDPESTKKNLMEINVAKQRNGPIGSIEMVFLKQYQKLVELQRS